MKTSKQTNMRILKQQEIAQVQGGRGPAGAVITTYALDKWGNAMSHEDWMERKVRMATGSGEDPHDFYDPGFDSDKPKTPIG